MKKKLLIIIPSVCLIFITVFLLTLPDIDSIAKGRISDSSFMKLRRAQAKDRGDKRFRIHQRYVPLKRISRWLIYAVLISEDDAFYTHKGFDWNGIKVAIEKNMKGGRMAAGGSTITQQVAKNLFLSPSRSLLRKSREAVIAWKLENSLSKDRILEIYLNIAEWGKGIFGVESAARRFFKTRASRLKISQGALLASMLPYPVKKKLSKARYRRILAKTRIILKRMLRRKLIRSNQYRRAVNEAAQYLKKLRYKVVR